ncbi:hypothetical protein ACLKA6_004409 [Drosophila palustris]
MYTKFNSSAFQTNRTDAPPTANLLHANAIRGLCMPQISPSQSQSQSQSPPQTVDGTWLWWWFGWMRSQSVTLTALALSTGSPMEQCMTNRYFTPISGIMPIFGVVAAAVPKCFVLVNCVELISRPAPAEQPKSNATLRWVVAFWAGFDPHVHVLHFPHVFLSADFCDSEL